MPRPEGALNPDVGPIEKFAHGLRQLRHGCGSPTYKQMARRVHFSVTALSQAAAGREFPSLAVTLGYVRACGGDESEWAQRWKATADLLRATDLPEALTDSADNGPYLGLAAFQPEHSRLFFGRENLISTLVDRLNRDNFLAVFGASGGGKSSLLRAGVMPAVQSGRSRLGDRPTVVLFTPGERPLEQLAFQLAKLCRLSTQVIHGDLIEDPTRLTAFVRMICTVSDPATGVLLVVDQFEETFALCADALERERFVAALASVAVCKDEPINGVLLPVRMILGVRADFYSRCAEHPELIEALAGRQELVGQMTVSQLRAAIIGPASAYGLEVETGLVAELVAEVIAGGGTGTLPMMSHSLMETWNRRRGKRLTLASYREAGGLSGAIAQTAERFYATLTHSERQTARALLVRLTAPANDTSRIDTRRKVALADLLGTTDADLTASVLDRLVRSRLVTVQDGFVEIAHEALISHWPKFQSWLDSDREGLRIQRALTAAAGEWHLSGRSNELLWPGGRLATAMDWIMKSNLPLNDVERAFVDASTQQAADELAITQQRNRKLRRLSAALLTLVTITGAATVIAFQQRHAAQHERDVAAAGKLAALSVTTAQSHPLSILLSLESLRLWPNKEGQAALLQNLLHPRNNSVALAAQSATVYDVAFSPDGAVLVSAGEDRTLRRWNTDSGLPIGDPMRGHIDPVGAVAVSPDGRTIASASDDNTVRLWALSTGQLLHTFAGHEDNAKSVAISNDSKTVISAGKDRNVRLWSAPAGIPVGPPLQTNSVLWAVALSPDGRTIIAAGDSGEVFRWSLHDRTPMPIVHSSTTPIKTLTFSPDGSHIVAGTADGTVRVWDAHSGTAGRPILAHNDAVESVAVTPDSMVIVSAGRDRTIRRWRLADGTPVGPALIGHDDQVRTVAISTDGKHIASGSRDRTIRLWETVPAKPLGPILPNHDQVVRMTISPNGRFIASTGQKWDIRIWHADTGEPAGSPMKGHRDEVRTMVYSPDGKMLVSASEDGTVRRWDANTSQPIGDEMRGHTAEVLTVAVSPDGSRIVSGSWDGTLQRWDANSGGKIGEPLRLHEGADIQSLAWSPDGTTIVSASGKVVQRWDPTTGSLQGAPMTGHSGLVETVDISPDSKLVVSAGVDRTIRRWRATDGSPVGQPLQGHTSRIVDIAFTPDGKEIVSADERGTVRRWDAKTGKQTGEPLTEYIDHVGHIKLGPGGMHLGVALPDASLSVFPSNVDQWIAAACNKVGRNLTAEEWSQYVGPTQPYHRTCANLPAGLGYKDAIIG